MPTLIGKVQTPAYVDSSGRWTYHSDSVSKLLRFRSAREIILGVRAAAYGAFDCRTDIIVVHPARVIYFAVPKVANSSFKRVLAQAIPGLPESRREKSKGKNNTVFSDPAIRRWMRGEHVLLCKHQLGSYTNYLKLAFVRNPWDRLVSCYTQKIDEQSFDDPRKRGVTKSLVDAGLYHDEMSFGDFARAVCRIPDERANRHFRSQASFLVDNRGNLLVDEVRRFEELQEGFLYLKSLLGRDDLELPHLKRTARRDYREYYDEETAELVGHRYAADLSLFGYEF